MPKPHLFEPDEKLCSEIIETFLEGHKQWRPDLQYPESHSDMKAGVMALLKRFELKRRPLDIPLRLQCRLCEGKKDFVTLRDHGPGHRDIAEQHCPNCDGKGYVNE